MNDRSTVAVMESFFSTVKSELGEHFESHGLAKMEVFDYIEVFYNQRRRHSTLGQVSPVAFERRAREEGVDAMENRPDRGFPQAPPSSLSMKEKGPRRPINSGTPSTESGQAQRQKHVRLFSPARRSGPIVALNRAASDRPVPRERRRHLLRLICPSNVPSPVTLPPGAKSIVS